MAAFLRHPPWSGPTPFIRGEQVYLRPPQPSDWADWARLRAISRDYLVPWEPTWLADELTRNAFRRRLRRYQRDARDGVGYAFLLFRIDDNKLLGGITLTNIRRGVTQSGAIGYWTGRPFAGQGYMTDGVKAISRYVFRDLGLHRLEAACLPSNLASQAVLTKAGFQQEGYCRQYLKINGAWRDHILFAILED